ncbi:predicted protein [Postia placenta Mad-698-R]|nr:predicted protein [Postia placenta Mad-698-R]
MYIWNAEKTFPTLLFFAYRYSALLNLVNELLARVAWPRWQTMTMTILSGAGVRVDESDHIHLHLRHVGTYTRLRERIHSLYSVNHWQSNDYEIRGYRATSDMGQYSYVLDTLVMMVAKGASVISDGLVLILTCVKTLSSTCTMDSVNGKKDTLSSILLKDRDVSRLQPKLLGVVNIIGIATRRIIEFVEI